MIHITICDDEATEVAYLGKLVQKWADKRMESLCLSTFESAESFLFAYEDDKSTDILLLDIQMKNMDGMALAKELRKENKSAQIAFITGFPDYMAQGYEVSALHYLIKPVSEDKLFEVLDRAIENLAKPQKSILLENEIVQEDSIIYIEALDHFLDVHTSEGVITVKMPLYQLSEKLTETEFIRCHRSYIVNLRYIRKITRTDIALDSGQLLPLSRRLYDTVNKAMLKYLAGSAIK